jgi:catechol 2,3-dioxygenase-like lactoylglutathione lyase family enzyme
MKGETKMKNVNLTPHNVNLYSSDKRKAKQFYDSLGHEQIEEVGDTIILGGKFDWLDFDMDDPSSVFKGEFFRLVEEYCQYGENF